MNGKGDLPGGLYDSMVRFDLSLIVGPPFCVRVPSLRIPQHVPGAVKTGAFHLGAHAYRILMCVCVCVCESGCDVCMWGGWGFFLGGLQAPDRRSGPFDPASSPGQHQTGYTVAGVGWYRKSFASPAAAAAGGRTVLRFDGVYMRSDVYVNEILVGSHPYG